MSAEDVSRKPRAGCQLTCRNCLLFHRNKNKYPPCPRKCIGFVMDISPSSTLSTFALNLSFFCFLASQQENPCQAQPRISATLQTHRQGEHTCTLWKRTGICIKDTQETKVAKHDRCATTGLTWFLSLGHEALYGTEKRNRYMNVFNKLHSLVWQHHGWREAKRNHNCWIFHKAKCKSQKR